MGIFSGGKFSIATRMAGEFLDQIQVLKVWHLSFIVSSNIQAT
jgi:hypothetical protein